MADLIVTVWLTSGLTMLFAMVGDAGLPQRWASDNDRVNDYRSLLFGYLPLCLIAGPLGWAVFLWVRLRA